MSMRDREKQSMQANVNDYVDERKILIRTPSFTYLQRFIEAQAGGEIQRTRSTTSQSQRVVAGGRGWVRTNEIIENLRVASFEDRFQIDRSARAIEKDVTEERSEATSKREDGIAIAGAGQQRSGIGENVGGVGHRWREDHDHGRVGVVRQGEGDVLWVGHRGVDDGIVAQIDGDVLQCVKKQIDRSNGIIAEIQQAQRARRRREE